jgi:hypothetical protein|tara:strand:- start:1107 stop:1535 length:429 start_codon:yes stop_codon:yes gene_type:complete
MADGDTKDYAGQKKKPSMALIISVGPKMPKSPEDTSKPDDKAMKKAWDALTKQMGAGMDGLDEDGNYPGPVSSDDLQDSVSQEMKDMTDEETRRKIMQMLPPVPPREQRRNMMRDGTPHTPGQRSMIDRATEMYRQQKMKGN